MPSLDLYKKINNAKTIGQAHKKQSDDIIEHTWDTDIDSRIGWFYDQEHDDQFDIEDNMNPEKSRTKIPVEVKLFEMEYNSLSKDQIAYHLMFKPSYKPNIPYYDDVFKKPLGAHFPIGLYCDVADSEGIYHRWLVVGQYREYSNQFPTYLVLPCDFCLKWIYKNQKMKSWSVLKSQSSYNEGTWLDFKVRSPENQKIVWTSSNDITRTIFYDQRIAISAVREQPVVWRVSKVEDMNVKGIARYTLAQDVWDTHSDYIEKDGDGNVLGIWCNYFDNKVTPEKPEEPESNIYCTITYKGVQNNQFKINGSPRVFTVTFYKDETIIPYQSGDWTFMMDGKNIDNLFSVTQQQDDTTKIKFLGSDNYIGHKVVLKYISNEKISSEIEMNIAGN